MCAYTMCYVDEDIMRDLGCFASINHCHLLCCCYAELSVSPAERERLSVREKDKGNEVSVLLILCVDVHRSVVRYEIVNYCL